MSAELRPQNCGDCKLFDTNKVSGEPFGSIRSGKAKLVMGVCRAPFGLLLQARVKESRCMKPSSFTSKQESSSTALAEPAKETVVFITPKPQANTPIVFGSFSHLR